MERKKKQEDELRKHKEVEVEANLKKMATSKQDKITSRVSFNS